ncbi:MAG TPA: hypothetical protein VM818_20250 [Vicinamibacterales bacterium]|jgi:hypothetical protein|nr:hypothetical protein [Vicinamibacterales bacterium]
MIGLIVLVILGVFLWKLWAPGLTFVPGFASLLEQPAGESGLWPFLRGVERIGGQYRGRPVVLIVHHKRGKNTLGYLTVAMQLVDAHAVSNGIEAPRERLRETVGRDAWDELELRHELKLSFADGWLKAMWQPGGFVIFPGRFEPERWGSVLRSMHAVVTSLEREAPVAPPR